ncbi:MAG: hypothetical protein RLZZ200_1817 [Pseudomonadota bacterium]
MADVFNSADLQRTPMERFAKAHAESILRVRTELQIQPAGSASRYTVELIGVDAGTRMVIVSAPRGADRSLMAVHQGQIVICRWMNPSTAFRFEAAISRLVFDPVPVLYLGEMHGIQFRQMRELPRARTAIAASLRTPVPMAAMVTDLSVSGARIGVSNIIPLDVGQDAELSLRVRLFQQDFTLTLACRIASDQGETDPEHRDIHFYGLGFLNLRPEEQLTLHGIVQQQLASDTDRLSRLLQSEASQGTLATQIMPLPNFPPRDGP